MLLIKDNVQIPKWEHKHFSSLKIQCYISAALFNGYFQVLQSVTLILTMHLFLRLQVVVTLEYCKSCGSWTSAQPLCHNPPRLYVPIRWSSRSEGAEGPVEMELPEPYLDLHQTLVRKSYDQPPEIGHKNNIVSVAQRNDFLYHMNTYESTHTDINMVHGGLCLLHYITCAV